MNSKPALYQPRRSLKALERDPKRLWLVEPPGASSAALAPSECGDRALHRGTVALKLQAWRNGGFSGFRVDSQKLAYEPRPRTTHAGCPSFFGGWSYSNFLASTVGVMMHDFETVQMLGVLFWVVDGRLSLGSRGLAVGL